MPKEKTKKVKELGFILELVDKITSYSDNSEKIRQFLRGYITGLIFLENEENSI